jgi:hypothetical protein
MGVMGCLNILNDANNMSPDKIQDLVNTTLLSVNYMNNEQILDISKKQYSSRANLNNKVGYQVLASEATHSLKYLPRYQQWCCLQYQGANTRQWKHLDFD